MSGVGEHVIPMTGRGTDVANGVWHVGLTVTDVDRSVEFYTSVVGFTLDKVSESASPVFHELTNNSRAMLRVAWLRSDIGAVGVSQESPNGGRMSLQLVEYRAGGDAPAPIEHTRAGSPHLCILVDDVHSTFDALSARGDVIVTSPLVAWPDGQHSFYIEDPDRVPIEFMG